MMESMNIEEMRLNLEKIKMYHREFKTNFSNISEIMRRLNRCYGTSNTSKLVTLKNDLENKFSVIKVNQYDNEIILLKQISLYTETTQSVSENFKNIDWKW